MSRSQSGLPLKSNALKMPVPVITKTLLPSVTGEGEDMFCLFTFMLPPPSSLFHSTAPLFLSTIHRYKSLLLASATLRKMASPQMIGVAPLRSGMGSFQAMLSSGVQRTGRFFSGLIPFSPGPRHCGQFSASRGGPEAARRANARHARIMLSPPRGNGRRRFDGRLFRNRIGAGQSQRLAQFGIDLLPDIGIILEELLGVLATLPDPLAFVAEPGAALLDEVMS